MGAFFIFDNNVEFDRRAVEGVFAAKGFSEPEIIRTQAVTIWLYPKVRLKKCNISTLQDNTRLAVIGTLVYKGLPPEAGTEALLQDYLSDTIDHGELIGAYAAVFINRSVDIMLDASCVFDLFASQDFRIISSSFLAVARSGNMSVDLDREALLMNLMLGFIPGTRTIVSGIRHLSGSRVPVQHSHVRLIHSEVTIPDDGKPPENFHAAVDSQIVQLDRYMEKIKPFAESCHGSDLGISGGFDSRLLLGLTCRNQIPVSGFSHLKKSPDPDPLIARDLADRKGIPFRIIETRFPEELSESELFDRMKRAFFYFDGRVHESMEYLREEYTGDYRLQILDDHSLGLSGVGGEIYRNYKQFNPLFRGVEDWLICYAFGYHRYFSILSESAGNELLEMLSEHVSAYVRAGRTDMHGHAYFQKYLTEIWMPDWHGLRNSVENQSGYYLSPFTQRQITLAANKIYPWIGSGGAFQAAMIHRVDPALSSLRTSYGYQLDKIPLSIRLKQQMKMHISPRQKIRIQKWKYRRKSNFPPENYPLVKAHPFLLDYVNFMKKMELPIDWNFYICNRDSLKQVISLGFSLSAIMKTISL